jgi:uncharacterized protein (DUF362 family)
LTTRTVALTLEPYPLRKQESNLNRKPIQRRDFITTSGLAAAALAGLGRPSGLKAQAAAPTTGNLWPGRVAEVYNAAAVDASGSLRPDPVREMVDRAVLELTGAKSVAEAWAKLLPGIGPDDAVGIKINVINPKLPTHPEVVAAVVAGLKAIGVKENNILIWDRVGNGALGSFPKSGYTLNDGPAGARCLGTDHEKVGWDSQVKARVPSVSLEFPVSRLASEMVKYTINVPVLKDHGTPGITYALKNYYGAIPLADAPLLAKAKIPRMHTGNGNPQIAELYNNPVFRDKTRLHLGDALIISHLNGPGGPPTAAAYTIHASTDPVAMDALGLEIIDQKRKASGLEPAAKRAGFIEAAAKLLLGQADRSQMDLRQVKLG